MATITISEVRAGIAAKLASVAGLLKVHEKVPDSMSAPCAVVQPSPGDLVQYSPTMGDVADYLMLVSVYVPGADAIAGQELLDPFLAPSGVSSIAAAINGDGTLGGLVASAVCQVARNYHAETWDEQRYLTVDFPILVMTK